MGWCLLLDKCLLNERVSGKWITSFRKIFTEYLLYAHARERGSNHELQENKASQEPTWKGPVWDYWQAQSFQDWKLATLYKLAWIILADLSFLLHVSNLRGFYSVKTFKLWIWRRFYNTPLIQHRINLRIEKLSDWLGAIWQLGNCEKHKTSGVLNPSGSPRLSWPNTFLTT